MLSGLFKKRPEKLRARELYEGVLEAARQPGLYGADRVPDTLEGRFELVILHTSLVIRVLQASEDETHRALSQHLFDAMFDDFDAAMREMGVGDSGVGKKIRFMAEGFYGRASAYDEALKDEDPGELDAAIARNIFASEVPNTASSELSAYVRASVEKLDAQGALTLAETRAPDFARVD